MIVTIWGKNASGKSTVASNLACVFAKRGFRTALIGANRFYGSIQYFFDMEIKPEKSMRGMLSGDDSLSVGESFTECAAIKNLYIASLSDQDDCAGYRILRVDSVVRFINLVKNSFDLAIFDGDESIEDPLSMYSLTMSDRIVYVTRPSLKYAVFAKAYESIVTGLQVTDRISVLFIGEGQNHDYAAHMPFGLADRYHVLPLYKALENFQGTEQLIVLAKGIDRISSRYRETINNIADSINPKRSSNGI